MFSLSIGMILSKNNTISFFFQISDRTRISAHHVSSTSSNVLTVGVIIRQRFGRFVVVQFVARNQTIVGIFGGSGSVTLLRDHCSVHRSSQSGIVESLTIYTMYAYVDFMYLKKCTKK